MRCTNATIRREDARLLHLLSALRKIGSPDAQHLADRLHRCRAGRLARRGDVASALRWPWRCRSVACWACRSAITGRKSRQAHEDFEGRDNADCSYATIVLARVGDLSSIRDLVRGARRDVRNLRDTRSRLVGPRWRSVEFRGVVEVDAIHPMDTHLLEENRRELIPSLPQIGAAADVVWLPHMHLTVHHPGLDRAELHNALTRQWPGEHRVHVRAFDLDNDASVNAWQTTGYSLKHRMSNKFRCTHERSVWVIEEWPMSWQAAYYAWMHSMRRGLQPLTIRVGAMGVRARGDDDVVQDTSDEQEDDVAPMPVVFGWSALMPVS